MVSHPSQRPPSSSSKSQSSRLIEGTFDGDPNNLPSETSYSPPSPRNIFEARRWRENRPCASGGNTNFICYRFFSNNYPSSLATRTPHSRQKPYSRSTRHGHSPRLLPSLDANLRPRARDRRQSDKPHPRGPFSFEFRRAKMEEAIPMASLRNIYLL